VYPEKFVRDNVVAPFSLLFDDIVLPADGRACSAALVYTSSSLFY